MVDRYLNEGAGRVRPKSRERHEGCFKLHLVPYFKTLSIKAIGVKDVAAYIRFREKKGAAANTIYKELAALSAVFTFLVRDEVLVQNPVLAVQKPKLHVIRPNYTPTLEEVNLIFEQIAQVGAKILSRSVYDRLPVRRNPEGKYRRRQF